MSSNYRKIIAIILSFTLLAAFCAVPMSVSATPPEGETYEDYDVIYYSDLLKGGNHLASGGTTLSEQNNPFTYTATSDTHSAIYKFRWVAGNGYFQMYPGQYVDKNPFQYRINIGSSATWQKRYAPGNSTISAGRAINAGDEFDIEIGRLMVATGDNAGKYYSYFKVDGTLIFEVYVDTSYTTDVPNSIIDGIQLNNEGGKSSQIKPIPDTYEDYDIITYDELRKGGNPLAEGSTVYSGNENLTYTESTAATTTHSVIFRLRWIAGTADYFQIQLGGYGSSNNFGYRLNGANWQDRGTGGTIAVSPRVTSGDILDFEVARLKVKSGDNIGKYYTYYKVNDTVIFEKVVSASVSNTTSFLNNGIYLGINSESTIAPIPDTLADYDAIGYSDLIDDHDNYLTEGGATLNSHHNLYHYNATSGTHSAVYYFRYVTGSCTYLQMYPGKYISDNPFQYRINTGVSASWEKRYAPGNRTISAGRAINAGDEFDIEIGRIMVEDGGHAGMYYSYFKVDGNLIFEEFVEEWYAIDDSLLDSIQFSFNGANSGAQIKPMPDTYEEYDEIGYLDLTTINDGKSTPAAHPDGWEIDNAGEYCEYDGTSPTKSAIFKFRWTIGDAAKLWISFDGSGSKGHTVVYMFGAIIENGKINFRPQSGGSETDIPAEILSTLTAGSTHDVEFARLKVATGSNTGKYYMYITVDGVKLAEGYVAADVVDGSGNYSYSNNDSTNCTLSYRITFNLYGTNDHIISEIPVPETYEDYDEVGYFDLTSINDGGSTAAANPNGWTLTNTGRYCEYAGTSATKSAIFKFRWTINNTAKLQISFDRQGNSGHAANYMFGAIIQDGQILFRPESGGYTTALPSDLLATLTNGSSHDVEFARLKVKTGRNTGKYYMYMKIDGVTVGEGYVAKGVVDESGNYAHKTGSGTVCTLSYLISVNIYGSGISGTISSSLETPDQIGYHDLLLGGNPLPSRTAALNNKTIFTYERTSESYSAVLKYRWTAGSPAKFSLSFDTDNTEGTGSESFPFCAVAKYPNQYGYGATAGANGAWQINPEENGLMVNMDSPLVAGNSYDIEFGRIRAISSTANKYYVYLKVDDVLIQSYYYTVNSDGTYKSTCLSNNIVFTVYGSTGNRIRSYGAPGVFLHEGTRGDFDGAYGITTLDFKTLGNIILGLEDASEMPAGIADFNNSGSVDVRDYVAIKKYLAPTNEYEKSGNLVLGTQEHLLEDETKTAAYIADASATLGATSYRLSTPIQDLYSVTSTNGVTVKSANMEKFKGQVAALKAQGINEILYVTDSFILPYGYSSTVTCHNKTVPNPDTDTDNYIAWLTVNSLAFGELAEEVPEIKFFEPFNEINLTTTRFEKPGVGWSATTSQQAPYKYSVEEKAGIMADLCWYISKAVKSVNPANQVTTPSIVVGSYIDIAESTFLGALYTAIESGDYPIDNTVGDTRIDNYFTIVNIHAYPEYASSGLDTKVNNIASDIGAVYTTMQAHSDGGSRVWITETGVSTFGGRTESNAASLISKFLTKVDNNLTYIDTVIFYKVADASTSAGLSEPEQKFGLFYAGDAASNPYAAKQTAKAVYSFFHNGSTNYSSLTALAGRYN